MRLYRMAAGALTKPLRKGAVSRVFYEFLAAANKVTRMLPTMTPRKAGFHTERREFGINASLRTANRKLDRQLPFSLDYHS
jgi:hypothetical protein